MLTAAARPAQASLRVSDDALARSSAAAVHGTVVATSAHWDPDADTIYTFVTIDVSRAWGLDGPPARVVVKQLGGLVGGTAFVVGGQARFAVGEEVLVFLDVRPRDRTLSVAGLEHGKWVLTGAADPAAAAMREVRGTDPAVTVARDYRSTASLDVLAALAGSRVRATGAVLDPVVPAARAGDGRDVSLAFTTLSTTPARWHEGDSGASVFVDTQAGGHPQFAGGGLSQLANAAVKWSAVGSLRLATGVARTARCFSNSENDGRLSVTYGDPCGEIADGSSTLAIGGAYFSSSQQRTINGVTYWKVTKGMVVTDNPTSKWSGFTTGCYEDVLVHEIGHAIGFGHSASNAAIMYPSISGSCFSRAVSMPLGADDLAGMAALYPGASQPLTPPGTPTGLAANVVGSTVSIAWNPPASGGAATGFQLLAGTVPGVANLGVVPLTAPGLVVPGVPNGLYYVRVVATNAAGASAPTLDLPIAVGQTPPGAPRNLAGTAAPGGHVSLTWLPPSSGPTPTSYVVLAGYTPGANTFQIPVPGTSLAGGGVPPAVYYVRVVAMNGAVPGPVSNEVTLVVP